MSDQLRFFLAVAATIVLSIMTVAMLLVALVWSSQAIGAFILALLFGVGTIFSAVFSYRFFQHRGSQNLVETVGRVEPKILKLAASEGGRLSAEKTAMQLNISVAQAESALEQLTNQGTAEMQVSGSGAMIYEFPNLLEAEQDDDTDPMEALEQELGYDPDAIDDEPQSDAMTSSDLDVGDDTELDLDADGDTELDLDADSDTELDLDADDDTASGVEDDLLAELEQKVKSKSDSNES